MTESLVGGILGDEDEKPQVETPETLASAEAFAAAVSPIASRQDPEVVRKTAQFLEHQSRLLETQREHLTNSAVCRMPPAVRPQRLACQAPGRVTSNWTCRRPVSPLARSRGSSRSVSGMTCTSTGISSRLRPGA